MKFLSIDEYKEGLDEKGSQAVCDFVDFMEREFPNVAPRISYAMPMWWVGEKMYDGYVGISAAKKHYSIHFHDVQYLASLSIKLTNCTFGKRCINIKYGDGDSIKIVKQAVSDYFSRLLFK